MRTVTDTANLDAAPNGVKSEAPDKRFCMLTVFLCAAIFAGIAVLNFLTNPYAQYPTAIVTPLVQTSRATKVRLIRAQPEAPNALVMGSSRVLKFEPERIQHHTGLSAFNAGVNYGKPEDFLALWRFFRTHHHSTPKLLLVGVDTSALSSDARFDDRLLACPDLIDQIADAVPWSDRFHRYRQLLNWDQTKASAKSLVAWARSQTPPEPKESFRTDGVIVYHQREQQIEDGTFDCHATLEFNKGEYVQLYADYEQLSHQRRQLFTTLLRECHRADTTVIVFATTMHPALRAHMEMKRTTFRHRNQEVVAYLSSTCSEFDYAFYDFTSTESYGGDPACFVDGIHPLEANTRRMIDIMLRDRHAWN